MISPTLESFRIFLHVLAVAVWVGGQIVLAGLVPAIRTSAPEVLPKVAQAFARVAWPAMIVIVFTGMWGLTSSSASDSDTEYMVTFAVKMVMVFIAIAATIVHSQGSSKAAKAIGGALGLLGSLLAAYAGILLAHVG
jgi:putative copper export protein